jgi:hypothetical protein
MLFDRATTVKFGVEHADSEVENGEWPDTSNSEAYSPHSAEVRLVTSCEDDQEDGYCERPAK